MRKDENGNVCPATLGEYRDKCVEIVGEEGSRAVEWLDRKIASERMGRDAIVIAPDSQMRELLAPMLCADAGRMGGKG